ncbi:MAG: hypothetical protein ACYTX0_14040 [Nostoc sp.]
MISTDHLLFTNAQDFSTRGCANDVAPSLLRLRQRRRSVQVSTSAQCPMPHSQNIVIPEQNNYLISERNRRLYGIRSILIKVKIFE